MVPDGLKLKAPKPTPMAARAKKPERVEYTVPQLEVAAELGFPVVRVQIGADPATLERLVPVAERLGLHLGHPHSVALRIEAVERRRASVELIAEHDHEVTDLILRFFGSCHDRDHRSVRRPHGVDVNE